MSRQMPTPIERIELDSECPECRAGKGAWCVTASGRPAVGLHSARSLISREKVDDHIDAVLAQRRGQP